MDHIIPCLFYYKSWKNRICFLDIKKELVGSQGLSLERSGNWFSLRSVVICEDRLPCHFITLQMRENGKRIYPPFPTPYNPIAAVLH